MKQSVQAIESIEVISNGVEVEAIKMWLDIISKEAGLKVFPEYEFAFVVGDEPKLICLTLIL